MSTVCLPFIHPILKQNCIFNPVRPNAIDEAVLFEICFLLHAAVDHHLFRGSIPDITASRNFMQL